MNVFKVFATMSLVDAISRPLARIQSSLNNTDGLVGGLSARLGRLATAFGRLAVPAAVFLGSLGALTGEAIAFESKMADVAKVVDFESPAELQQMSRALQDLSLQIPIAAEGFADITAAAAQSGIAKKDLVEFSVQAAKMGVAFDVAAGEASKTMADWRAGMGLTLTETYSLADAVNHLANNMNATASDISQVLNRMGAVGKAAGFSEKELAALAATGLSAGASAEVVGTGLNSIFSTLTQGSAMGKEAAAVFQKLGYDAEGLAKSMQMDAKGTIMNVFESIAALPKENQLSVISTAFGQMSLKSIAPMVGNLDNLAGALNLVGDAANYAGSMEAEYAARSATTENSIQLLKNSFNVLAITIGGYFLPVANGAAKGLTALMKLLISIGRSPAGGFFLKLAASIAAALVGVTGLIAAFAVIKPILIGIGAAFSGIFWPVTLIVGAVSLLALAWKKDFMGIASTLTGFASKVKLVFQGVLEIFKTLQNGRGELSADWAEKIEAAGLMGLVTTVSRVVYRVMTFFKGLVSSIRAAVQPALSRLGDAFRLLISAVRPLFGHITKLAGGLSRAAGKTDTTPWLAWGQVIGDIAGGALRLAVDVIGMAVAVLTRMGQAVNWLSGLLGTLGGKLGDALFAAITFAIGVKDSVSDFASSISDGVGKAIDTIKNFSLIDAGMGLINGFADGIKAGAENLVSAVSGVLDRVRAYLPFSDAKTGPFSNLTDSGMAFISTFAAGIEKRAEALVAAVGGVLSKVRSYLPFSDAKMGPLSSLTASGMAIPGTLAEGVASGAPQLASAADNMFSHLNLAPPYYEMPKVPVGGAAFAGGRLPSPALNIQEGGASSSGPFRSRLGQPGGQRTINLHIGKIELPNVVDADGFVAGLEAIIDERFDA